MLFHSSTSHLFAFLFFVAAFLTVLRLTLVQGHQFLVSRPPLPEEGPIQADPISATSEAPEADEGQDGDDSKVSLEEAVRLRRLLLQIRKNLALIRRGSVSTSFDTSQTYL
jgi:hypothetical protein